MRLARRGLTVIELVLILVVIGLAIFFLLRMRGGDEAPAPGTADSAAVDTTGMPPIPAGAANPLAARLAVVAPRDSTAAAGDTLALRVRATTDTETTVARAIVRFEVTAGGGRVEPDSTTTDDLGEAEVRWILGDSAGPQTVRAAVTGSDAATTTVTVTATARAGAGR